MTTLLITGSRRATPAMLDYTRRVVNRCHQNDWLLIVGDAPGVDTVAYRWSVEIGLSVVVVGVTGAARNGAEPYEQVCHEYPTRERYLARDRYMVEHCDCCLAVWNGVSRGTIYTYNYAVKQGKQAWLKTFGQFK